MSDADSRASAPMPVQVSLSMGKGDGSTTAAIVTYIVLAQFFAVLVGVFALIVLGVKPDPVMLGVLGGLITATVASVSAAIGYWLGSSSGSKAANAALAQIAGGQ